ncbi:MAG: hypothetical protein R6W90_09460 [Ignavibacteriaceae bacterium]
MDAINFEQFKSFTSKRNFPSVSIYMPAYRKGAEVEQGPIMFKNQLRETEKKLTEKGFRKHETDELLEPARALINDTDFWNHQEDGLAVFISPGEFFYYKVPEKFNEISYVSDRYYLRPFLTLMNTNERFLILTLNQKNVRLFESTRYNINEIELKNVMTSIEEYEATEEEDRSLQFHTETARVANTGKGSVQGARSAIFHGHGGGTDSAIQKEKILQFFNLLDNGLQRYLNTEKAPLLLAGIEYLIPIFRETNSYPYTMEESFNYNTQDLSETELRDSAWEIVKKRFDKHLSDALAQYGNYAGTKRASDKIEDIIKNVFSNRVLNLFINPNAQVWGKFDINSYRVEVHYNDFEAEDIDLIDLAAEQTLLHNGVVFSVDAERIPNGKPMAALFRY